MKTLTPSSIPALKNNGLLVFTSLPNIDLGVKRTLTVVTDTKNFNFFFLQEPCPIYHLTRNSQKKYKE